ncbi:MAG: hypothetical protein GVY13_14945 [Alphaproteobacteria bacterium]|jgi:hypothetical protein|nr:hypothetical protein [Alphaproteobacteria bacterium]
MAVTLPYRRTCRQFKNGSYAEGGRANYILHEKFAEDPHHYTRAFLIIQHDFIDLLEYIEQDERNFECYSYRIHALLMRVCIEIEANFTAILRENNYSQRPSNKWNIVDYRNLEITHNLSGFKVLFPHWRGNRLYSVFAPFESWDHNGKPDWYVVGYNQAKHDRHLKFTEANFLRLCNAISGLVAILSAQFYTNALSTGPGLLLLEGGPAPGFEHAIGDYFGVSFPNWPDEKRYDFDWQPLRNQPDPFQSLFP